MKKPILVPVDFSDATGAVIAEALRLAKALQTGMVILHVAPPEPEFVGYEPGPQSVRDAVARKLHAEHKELQALEASAKATGVDTTTLLIQGYAAEKVVQEAEKLEAGMIVMGSHGHGKLRQLLVGSVTDAVLRKSRVPVLIVPAPSA